MRKYTDWRSLDYPRLSVEHFVSEHISILAVWFTIYIKTTLNIDDTVMAQLKREAARQRRTMSELVETALRLLFRSEKKSRHLPGLPAFRSGGAVVDIAGMRVMEQVACLT